MHANEIQQTLGIWRKRAKLRPLQWQVISKLFAEADMFKAIAAYSLIQLLCYLGFAEFRSRAFQMRQGRRGQSARTSANDLTFTLKVA
jgi:hypothetical protein